MKICIASDTLASGVPRDFWNEEESCCVTKNEWNSTRGYIVKLDQTKGLLSKRFLGRSKNTHLYAFTATK